MQTLDTTVRYDGASSSEIVGTTTVGIVLFNQTVNLPSGATHVQLEFLGSANATETPWVAGQPGPEYLDLEVYRVVAGVETLLHSRRVMTRINMVNELGAEVHQDLDPNPYLLFVDELPVGTIGSMQYRMKAKTDQIDGSLKIARRQLIATVLG